jgi:hypothetical protein
VDCGLRRQMSRMPSYAASKSPWSNATPV